MDHMCTDLGADLDALTARIDDGISVEHME